MPLDGKKIYVAGHRGMVGSALVRNLESRGQNRILTRGRDQLDLKNQSAVEAYFEQEKPDVVFLAAAKVGGIHANNTFPAEFLYDNLLMAANIIHAAHRQDVERLVFLGSTCIYPKLAPQPIEEDSLLTGPLEPTNEAYAIAKIAGLKLCQFYRKQYGRLFHSAMPTNLYGPGDNYHPEHSHVLPALIRRFHEATENQTPTVSIWGSGTPKREFLHVDDCACGLIHLAELENPPDLVNLGTGSDVSIRELAELIGQITGYQGSLEWDSSKPDGTPRKLTDCSRLRATGWKHQISLREGIEQTYREDFLKAYQNEALRER